MKLTQRTTATGVTLNDTFIHVVNTGDTSQDPTGSSYKVPLSLLSPLFTGSTGVSGSGRNNYVVKWTPDGTTLGDSLMQDDGSNGSIGTSIQPDAKFAIYSNTASANRYTLEVGNNATLTTTSPNVGIYGYVNGLVSGSTWYSAGGILSGAGNDRENYGVIGKAIGVTVGENIGGYFQSVNGTSNYAVRLSDGSETVGGGKFLRDMGDGKANWVNITASDVTGGSGTTSTGGKTWHTVTGVNPTATLAPNSGYVIRDTNGGGTTDLTLPSSGVSVGDEIKIIATSEGTPTGLQTWRLLEGNGNDVIFADIWDSLAGNNINEVKSTNPLWTFDNTPNGNFSNQKACTILLTCVQDLTPGYAWSIEFPNNTRI